VSIQAVLQGAGLISGLVRIDITEAGRYAVCSVTLHSLEVPPTYCVADQFLFNLSSFYSEKKQILLKSAVHMTKDGQVEAGWELMEDVESPFGKFYYSLICSDVGRPLEPSDTLLFQLELSDDDAVFQDSCFIDAPASTLDGFQAAVVIKIRNKKQMLAGGQFEIYD